MVILANVSFPFLATTTYVYEDLLLSIFSLTIAALTGFNAFFGEEQTWRSRRQTEFDLKQAIAEWWLKMASAREGSDPEARKKRYVEATDALFPRRE